MEYIDLRGVKPSSSIDFMQALKKAKEESMQIQNQKNNDSERIKERIMKYNLYINDDTDNTGDCQFDSVADQLSNLGDKYEGITKEEVRSITNDWLRKNGDYKLNPEDPQSETLRSWVYITQDGLDWKDYCAKMAKAKEWGDEITFKAMTEAFNIQISLISSTVDENNFLSEHKPRTETPNLSTIYICHWLEVHYGSLITLQILEQKREKKKQKLFSLLKRANKNLQKKTILDIFCMDSPQNEIPLSTMEESFDDKIDIPTFFGNLQVMTGVYDIKIHRIKTLEDIVGPEELPKLVLPQNGNNGKSILNQGLLDNYTSKISNLEKLLEFNVSKLKVSEEEKLEYQKKKQ